MWRKINGNGSTARHGRKPKEPLEPAIQDDGKDHVDLPLPRELAGKFDCMVDVLKVAYQEGDKGKPSFIRR